jgi:UDP-glucose 4-epimerase
LVLLQHGHSVVMLDNLSNSFERVFEHMKKIAGDKADKMKFVQVGGNSNSCVMVVAAVASAAAILMNAVPFASCSAAVCCWHTNPNVNN